MKWVRHGSLCFLIKLFEEAELCCWLCCSVPGRGLWLVFLHFNSFYQLSLLHLSVNLMEIHTTKTENKISTKWCSASHSFLLLYLWGNNGNLAWDLKVTEMWCRALTPGIQQGRDPERNHQKPILRNEWYCGRALTHSMTNFRVTRESDSVLTTTVVLGWDPTKQISTCKLVVRDVGGQQITVSSSEKNFCLENNL